MCDTEVEELTGNVCLSLSPSVVAASCAPVSLCLDVGGLGRVFLVLLLEANSVNCHVCLFFVSGNRRIRVFFFAISISLCQFLIIPFRVDQFRSEVSRLQCSARVPKYRIVKFLRALIHSSRKWNAISHRCLRWFLSSD